MLIRRTNGRTERSGATLVECAIVLPVFLFIVIALMVGGVGVFRYEELATLAHEGARYASVNGYSHGLATETTPATAQNVYDNAIRPKAVAMDLTKLNYTVTWSPDNKQGSMVTVTVTYLWVPETFLPPITLTSSASAMMQY